MVHIVGRTLGCAHTRDSKRPGKRSPRTVGLIQKIREVHPVRVHFLSLIEDCCMLLDVLLIRISITLSALYSNT
jgi:hypothetical protein